jgi:prolyl oligopeptidase
MKLAKYLVGALPLLVALVLVIFTPLPPSAAPLAGAQDAMPFAYPPARRDNTIDNYHGTEIADPYRWLEAPDSPETRAWVTAENKLTESFLSQIPQRDAIRKRLTALWNYERFGLPHKKGQRYFYTRNDGLQNQSVLYVADTLEGEPRVLLDPNTLSQDGTVSLTGWQASDDGARLAFGLASAGSDWQEWKVLDVATGKLADDHLRWVKFSGASWKKDGSGFYYSRYDAPDEGEAYTAANFYHKLYFHKLGTPQAEDKLIYERPDEKEWNFSGHVTDDGQYLLILVWRGSESKNLVFYQALDEADAPVVELINTWEASFDYLGNEGEKFWLATDLDAPQQRVIQIDLAAPARDQWREIVPEAKDTLSSVSLVGDRLVCQYLHDVQSQVKLFTLAGEAASEIKLPDGGVAGGFGGERTDRETFYYFTNLTTPTSIFRYDFDTQESTLFRRPNVDFDASPYVAEQVFYASKDGTKIPLTIVCRRDIQLDGSHPTILYGYGGFNIPQLPGFSVTTATWLELGGVYAVANLRGGGEYGRAWHDAGKLDNKQNVFDDFIAAAEYLIETKYTSRAKLAISGRSNGGLLVGACMTQRPELFGAALPGVGVLDMLRYHQFTIGRAWAAEFGSADDPKQFKTLLAYSPLHNLKPGTHYPPTLINTGDHDDRVVPAHSYKFAAELQRVHAGDAPVLIRIDTSAGHGGGKPTTKLIDETADTLAFLVKVLKVAEAKR